MLLYTKVFTSLFDITFIRNALVGEIPFSKTLNFLFVQKKNCNFAFSSKN